MEKIVPGVFSFSILLEKNFTERELVGKTLTTFGENFPALQVFSRANNYVGYFHFLGSQPFKSRDPKDFKLFRLILLQNLNYDLAKILNVG